MQIYIHVYGCVSLHPQRTGERRCRFHLHPCHRHVQADCNLPNKNAESESHACVCVWVSDCTFYSRRKLARKSSSMQQSQLFRQLPIGKIQSPRLGCAATTPLGFNVSEWWTTRARTNGGKYQVRRMVLHATGVYSLLWLQSSIINRNVIEQMNGADMNNGWQWSSKATNDDDDDNIGRRRANGNVYHLRKCVCKGCMFDVMRRHRRTRSNIERYDGASGGIERRR